METLPGDQTNYCFLFIPQPLNDLAEPASPVTFQDKDYLILFGGICGSKKVGRYIVILDLESHVIPANSQQYMTRRGWTFLGAEPILGGPHDIFDVGTSSVASSNIEAAKHCTVLSTHI